MQSMIMQILRTSRLSNAALFSLQVVLLFSEKNHLWVFEGVDPCPYKVIRQKRLKCLSWKDEECESPHLMTYIPLCVCVCAFMWWIGSDSYFYTQFGQERPPQAADTMM